MAMTERIKLLSAIYPQYQIGEGTYGELFIFDWKDGGTTITIGSYCCFSFRCSVLLGGDHRTDWVTTYPFSAIWDCAADIQGHPASKGDIHIGSDVWAGAECIVLSGVTIGDGAVIGARSVVNKDIPPYAIAVGNPARVIGYRFEPEVITRLLDIAWWHWPKDRIERAIPRLLNTDIRAFIAAYDRGEI